MQRCIAWTALFASEYLSGGPPLPDRVLLLIKLIALLFASGTCLWIADRRWNFVQKFLNEERSPRDLAIARIVIFAALLFHIRLGYTLEFARLDATLLVPPTGWSHIVALVPRQEMLVRWSFYVFLVAGVCAIVGLFTRVTAAATTILGFYLLTLTQIFGKINHDHHLILFAAVLALSPCADALSLDCWSGRIRCPAAILRARKYAIPLNGMALILGLCYYFPGAWKLCRLGATWFTAANMHTLIAIKLAELTPTRFQLWFAGQPSLLVLGAISTIVFELGFVFAIMNPRSRIVALVCGLAFHNTINLIMGIPFWTLQLSYVVLIDSQAVLDALSSHSLRALFSTPLREKKGVPAFQFSSLTLGLGVILAGMVLAGLGKIVNGWPFACYPTFDSASSLWSEIELDARDQKGFVHHANLSYERRLEGIYSPERWTALVGTVTNGALPHGESRADALVKIWKTQTGLAGPLKVDVYRTVYDFSQSHSTPLSRTFLYTLDE